jgi:hypothetical protein
MKSIKVRRNGICQNKKAFFPFLVPDLSWANYEAF